MIIGINGYIGSGKDTVGKMIQYLTSRSKSSFEDYFAETKDGIHFNVSEANLYTSNWKVKKFAGKLKQIATMLTGIPVEDFESQEVKASFLPKEWNYFVEENVKKALEEGKWDEAVNSVKQMTVREFLQRLGTEAVRNNLHNNAWVNALFADYKPIEGWPEYGTDEKGGTVPIGYNTIYPDWLITDTRFPNEAHAIKDRNGLVIRVERKLDTVSYQTLEQRHPSETSLDDWKFDYIIYNDGTMKELEKKVKTMMEEFKII